MSGTRSARQAAPPDDHSDPWDDGRVVELVQLVEDFAVAIS
jgi:hypothetical protein